MKHLIFISVLLFTQNVNANWVTFYKSQIFDAKLLLSSVSQVEQKTQALIVLKFKLVIFPESVASHVIFLEHICGGVNPAIIEEKFYQGEPNRSKEIYMSNKPEKFEKYLLKTFPKLIRQICI